MTLNQFLPAALFAISLSLAVLAAPPELTREDLSRIPPTELKDVQKTFQLKPGFELQVAAAEPNVYDPIEICFDENGRMFVVEMRDYSEMRDVTPHLGRIRLLEDKDSDGVFETATVYADDLPWPTGVICYGGGIYVAATPDLLYFKDTNGDGKADIRKTVFTGFGVEKDRLNVQALVNCLRWGLDNRIHGQTAGNGGSVRREEDTNAAPLNLNGRDFYFDPRNHEMTTEAGGGQYGMAFDDYGRRFVCSNSRHIMTFMYDSRYADRNRFYHMPAPLVDIPADGPAAEVFRTSPEEAWRVIRTKWRVTGVVQGIIEGGGRSSGYFTSATGISIYRGNAWLDEYRGDSFIADVGSNLLHRKKVRPQGVELVAERPADEQKVEFLTSKDLWFRPVELVNAPDGCLYLCDMYREVIEHPWSLPENIKKLIDLNAGNDRGRIYRIAPTGFKASKPPQLGKATTAELVAALEHKNAWHRETASRLLFERQDQQAVRLLVKVQTSSKSALGRLHALYALDGLGALKEANVLSALNDAVAAVREHGVKQAERFIVKGVAPKSLWPRLQELAKDSGANVRYQLAFTLGELTGTERLAALADLARSDADSRWAQAAILSSLAEGAGELFTTLSADQAFRNAKAGQEFLRQLISLVAAQGRREAVARALDFLNQVNDATLKFTMAQALGDGLQRAGHRLADGGGPAQDVLALAAATATKAERPEAERVAAIRLLSHRTYGEAGELLFGLLDQKEPQPVQLAALSTLARFTDTQVGSKLTALWSAFTPRLQAEALPVLLARPERAEALLKAIEAGNIRANVLDTTQTKMLQTYRDPKVRQLAGKVLATATTSSKQPIIDGYAASLTMNGDVARGRKIYQERCISCHRAGGGGFVLGPDLITVKTTGKEKLLTNIVDPNREVRPEFAAFTIETKDDESYVGLVVNQTSAAVTLRQAYGKEDVIPRASITKIQSHGLSVMPEGLEQNLATQDMADLLEYVSMVEK